MASTLPQRQVSKRDSLHDEPFVATIDAAEFDAAQRDPRVRAFLEEADAYLAELERQGRNG
jgi:hypothetical protein